MFFLSPDAQLKAVSDLMTGFTNIFTSAVEQTTNMAVRAGKWGPLGGSWEKSVIPQYITDEDRPLVERVNQKLSTLLPGKGEGMDVLVDRYRAVLEDEDVQTYFAKYGELMAAGKHGVGMGGAMALRTHTSFNCERVPPEDALEFASLLIDSDMFRTLLDRSTAYEREGFFYGFSHLAARVPTDQKLAFLSKCEEHGFLEKLLKDAHPEDVAYFTQKPDAELAVA